VYLAILQIIYSNNHNNNNKNNDNSKKNPQFTNEI